MHTHTHTHTHTHVHMAVNLSGVHRTHTGSTVSTYSSCPKLGTRDQSSLTGPGHMVGKGQRPSPPSLPCSLPNSAISQLTSAPRAHQIPEDASRSDRS